MGLSLRPVVAGVKGSLPDETRFARLTGDPGSVLPREVLDAAGIVPWRAERKNDDPRDAGDIDDSPDPA